MSHKKAPPVKHDALEMRGPRSRTESGSLREKRGDTNVGTIEEQYHRDFGVRSDMHLDTLLEKKRVKSLKQLLERSKRVPSE